MNSPIKLIVISFCVLFGFHLSAQLEPSASIKFKTTKPANPLIKSINKLTDDDAKLTEQVVTEIQTMGEITRIVNDQDFITLSDEQKLTVVKLSDVLTIINDFKK